MEFSKNELGSICGKAQPIVSSPHYPNTDSSNFNLKNENRFAEPTEQIFEVAPHQLFDFLQKYGVPDCWSFYGSVETNLNVVIKWGAK